MHIMYDPYAISLILMIPIVTEYSCIFCEKVAVVTKKGEITQLRIIMHNYPFPGYHIAEVTVPCHNKYRKV